jgi:predicted methyltransferase
MTTTKIQCLRRAVVLLTATVLLTPTRGQTPAGQAQGEASVHPGINAEYLKPHQDVTQWVERFEREGREIYEQRIEIVKAVQVKPGLIVADIGAGTGLFTALLAKAVTGTGKVYAVDIVKDFLKHVEERAAAAGLKNVETVLCTERSVELPPNSIDLAFLCDVYHHFEYPRSSLRSIHQALRPGGEMVLIDFKRIPGTSSDWILQHVRAGQAVVAAEVMAAGFEKVAEIDFLKDNYFLRFRRSSVSARP